MKRPLRDELRQKIPGHFTLIDPGVGSPIELAKLAVLAEEQGTDAILVGGSGEVLPLELDEAIKKIREQVNIPVIEYTADLQMVSPHADGLFFLSVINSRTHYYNFGMAALAAPLVYRTNIIPLPVALMIFEPGMTAGWVSDANPFRNNKPGPAVAYALAAQYFGFQFLYLEAGSGSKNPVSTKAIQAVARTIDKKSINIIVGGGITDPEKARRVIKAGADFIVTGSIFEKTKEIKGIIRAIKT
ncbi:MAG: geranylgeranylglyceryl/heptaprenylglyceryl phosphate synthase [Candidatus Hodarchaeota archaeon]